MSGSDCVEEAVAVLVIFWPCVLDAIVETRVRVVLEPFIKLPIVHIPVVVAKLPEVVEAEGAPAEVSV